MKKLSFEEIIKLVKDLEDYQLIEDNICAHTVRLTRNSYSEFLLYFEDHSFESNFEIVESVFKDGNVLVIKTKDESYHRKRNCYYRFKEKQIKINSPIWEKLETKD